MKIYDISQELFTSQTYPGDKKPGYVRVCDMDKDDAINITNIEMCVHNGTHVDAPKHFYKNGDGIDKIPLEKFVGTCIVVQINGNMTGENAEEILPKNTQTKRLLVKSDGDITLEAAKIINDRGLFLIGVEGQSVGDANNPSEVHRELLREKVVLLEGVRLKNVPCGQYFLFAAPINMADSDGSPCRCVLVDLDS